MEEKKDEREQMRDEIYQTVMAFVKRELAKETPEPAIVATIPALIAQARSVKCF